MRGGRREICSRKWNEEEKVGNKATEKYEERVKSK